MCIYIYVYMYILFFYLGILTFRILHDPNHERGDLPESAGNSYGSREPAGALRRVLGSTSLSSLCKAGFLLRV